MEELTEIRSYIQQERYTDALLLIDELEEMSKENKLNKIHSYSMVLLLYLIKQHAEHRSTRSWEFSIANAVHQIKRINKRRKSGACYADEALLKETLEEAFPMALKRTALEAFEGEFDELGLGMKVDKDRIVEEAFS